VSNTWKPDKSEVEKLSGPIDLREKYTLANNASKKLRALLNDMEYVHALGAVTGNQAMQMVKAGVPAIYCSGWQVAADANDSHNMYPDQSLYSVNSVPMLVRKINNSLKRAGQIEWMNNSSEENYGKLAKWLCPIVADAEAGFGGALNVFELTKAMIEAGAAGIHYEDQLSSAKKCGHLGGKVLVPASEHIKKLKAARLAAEVCGVNTVIVARTDANSARLLTSDIDEADHNFILREGPQELHYLERRSRTPEGFYNITGGIDMAISRGLQYAPYCDLIWCETSKPNLEEAKKFAEAIHAEFPGKMLAYNCSPSFNWKKHLDEETISQFQIELSKMGYKFQFVTLAGFHNLNYHMFDLARAYQEEDMSAYARLQEWEFDREFEGYTAHKHQTEVGTGYFDLVAQTIDKESSTTALKDSTEEEQF
jgi:isocitrate lyase